MRSLGVAAYALKSVVRNRRSTASALLGLVLGVAVVTAPWVAVDSSIRGLFNWYLDGVAVDVYAYGIGDEVANATRDLAGVPNVQQVVPTYRDIAIINASPSFVTSAEVYLVDSSFAGVIDRLGLSWSAPPATGTIVVPASYQATISTGDTVAIDRQTPVYDSNGTFIRWQTWSSRYTVAGFSNQTLFGTLFGIASVFLSSDDVARYRSDLNLTKDVPFGFLLSWLDRPALIDPLDPSGTSARLQRQRILMENALIPDGYSVSYGQSSQGYSLERIPSAIEERSFGQRLVFTGLTIPTLALSLLLVRVGFDVGLTPRRRELAILRSRGLSVRGVRAFLTLEAGVLAIVGGTIGLALGVVLSRLFLGAALAGTSGPAPVVDFAITGSTVVFALVFGALLAFGASWRGIRLLSSEDIVGVLKAHHAEEVAIPHRSSRDFMIAGVAAAGILLLLASASLKGSPFSPLGFLLGLSTAVLAPVAPFLLTIALARYLTRGTTRGYRVLARLFRPLLGEIHPVVERNLLRSPRRSSSIAMIVTFAVGFILAILILSASSEAYRMEEVLRRTPSDVVVEWGVFGIPHDNLTVALSGIRAIPGVATVTPVVSSSTERGYLVAFEASTYLDTVPWVTARLLGGVDPAALMASLDQGGVFAANPDLADPLGLQIGDSLFFRQAFGNDISLRLAAVVPRIPGLYSGYADEPFGHYAFVDLDSLGPSANLSLAEHARFLIRLTPGADSEQVANAASTSLGPYASARTADQGRREALADPFANVFFGFLLSQGELAVAILVVAIGLFVFSASAGRKEELATFVARGVRTRTVAALIMTEGWVVTILGILLGLFAALVTVWTVLEMLFLVNPPPTSVPFVIPATILLPLGLVVLGVFAAGWVGTVAIRRMDVVRVLKMRGG